MIGSNLTYEGLENLEQIKIARTAWQNQMVRRGREILKQEAKLRAGINNRITSANLPSLHGTIAPKPITPAPPAGSVPLNSTNFKPLREFPPAPKLPTGITTANLPPPSTAQKVRDIAEEASDTVNLAHVKFMTEYPRTYGAFQGTVQGLGGPMPDVSSAFAGGLGGALGAAPTGSKAVDTFGQMLTTGSRSL
jgi:hypothetical protein